MASELMKERKSQAEIDVSNLRFYAEMFKQHEWSTIVIHWGVFEQTLREIAERLEASETERDRLRVELQKIAFLVPTVCGYEGNRRFVDIEEIFSVKQRAAEAIDAARAKETKV